MMLFMFLLSINLHSQTNLVPNPSFEDTVSCPNNVGQIYNATSWQNPTIASPDYMNSCNSSMLGIPMNYVGNQAAHTGNAYSLIAVFADLPFTNSYREYIQTQLNLTLVKGEVYCVEFYVSLANGIYTEYAVNNLGAYLSPTVISNTRYDTLSYIPQVVNNASNPLTTMGSWTKVSDFFTAQGGEKYITIGNFNSNGASDTTFIKPTSDNNFESDYYIDDVSVIHIDADAGRDTAVCLGNGILLGRPASPGLTYSWQPSTGLSDPTIAQPIASPSVTTTYYLTATLTGGCSKLDTVTVTVVSADAGDDTTVCEGSSIVLGSPALTNVSYAWQPAAGLNDPLTSQPTVIANTSETYTITASANGCSLTDDISVTVLNYQSPLASAGTSQNICPGDVTQIGSTPVTGYSYLWSPAIYLNDANASAPFAKPSQSMQYTLTVSDTASIYMCKSPAFDSVFITVDDCPPEIPNVFTPNNDGINDVFRIESLNEGSDVSVYNRWGILLWNSSYVYDFWDGRTSSGEVCSEGIYFYILTTKEGVSYKGFVQLLR